MATKTLSIILLGGAKRVTLAEQIRTIVCENDYNAEFISVERDEGFYPISSLATTIGGPSFKNENFSSWLENLYNSFELPLIIPCMDAAIPAVAQLAKKYEKIVISTLIGAQAALNKIKTTEFCIKNDIQHPRRFRQEDSFDQKVIVKPLEGFGGKGIYFFDNTNSINRELFSTHIVQEFVSGNETTHDLYINRDGSFDSISRDRLAVIDGEVDHCIVREPSVSELKLFTNISKTGLFRGPITVQTINSDGIVYLIEINARLGGGVTASIAAGFPVIEYLIRDTFGIDLKKRRRFKQLEMKRARRDIYNFNYQSE